MFGKKLRSGISKAIKPAPRKPAPRKPAPRMLNPVNPGGGRNFADQLLGRTPPAGGGATSVINKGRSPFLRAKPSLPVEPGGVGTTGFKSGSGGFASNLFGTGMKKGGKVKAVSAPKASSASKKADGVAIKGKTKGRFV